MILFLTVIFLQRDIPKAYAVEDSLLTELQGALPKDGIGYLNSDPGGTGALGSGQEWFDWVQGILDVLYTDATCGEAPALPWAKRSACVPSVCACVSVCVRRYPNACILCVCTYLNV
jgi:hypothetical protein